MVDELKADHAERMTHQAFFRGIFSDGGGGRRLAQKVPHRLIVQHPASSTNIFTHLNSARDVRIEQLHLLVKRARISRHTLSKQAAGNAACLHALRSVTAAFPASTCHGAHVMGGEPIVRHASQH